MLDLRSARSAALSPPVIPAKPCARLLQAKPDRDVPSCAAAATRSRYARRESALRAAIRRVTSVRTGCSSVMGVSGSSRAVVGPLRDDNGGVPQTGVTPHTVSHGWSQTQKRFSRWEGTSFESWRVVLVTWLEIEQSAGH